MILRKIYIIEAFDTNGNLRIRRYAANKKTAEYIAKPYGDEANIRLLGKDEWPWINTADVERL